MPTNHKFESNEIFDINQWLHKSEIGQYKAHCVQYALACSQQAIDHSKLNIFLENHKNHIDFNRIGVSFGTGMGGIEQTESALSLMYVNKTHRKISPFNLPNSLPNTAAGAIAIRHQFQGSKKSFFVFFVFISCYCAVSQQIKYFAKLRKNTTN